MKRIIIGAFVLASSFGLASATAFAGEVTPQPVTAGETDKALLTADVAFWTSIQSTQKPEELQLYLQKFPNGMFSDLARQRLGAPTVAVPVDAGGQADQPPPVVVAPPVAPVVAPPPVQAQVIVKQRKIVRPVIRRVRAPIIVDEPPPRVRVIRRAERYSPPPIKRVRVVRRRYVPDSPYAQEPAYSPPTYNSAPAYDFRLNRDSGGGGGGYGGGGGGGGHTGGGWGG